MDDRPDDFMPDDAGPDDADMYLFGDIGLALRFHAERELRTDHAPEHRRRR